MPISNIFFQQESQNFVLKNNTSFTKYAKINLHINLEFSTVVVIEKNNIFTVSAFES